MARAPTYGIGWAVIAGVVGAMVGCLAGVVARGIPWLLLWSLSGFAVGAAQWLLVLRRWQIGPVSWGAATGFGSLVTILVHVYLVLTLSESGGRILDQAIERPGEYLFDGAIIVLVGGLTLGFPQSVVLRDSPVRRWTWATALGVLSVWLAGFALRTSLWTSLPPGIQLVAFCAIYWLMLTLPQALLIGRAVGLRVSTVSRIAAAPADVDAKTKT